MKYWITLMICLLLAESSPADSAGTNAPDASAAPARTTGRTFPVKGYLVQGNTLLPPQKIGAVLKKYTGPAIDLKTLTEGLGELQLLYRHLGYATVSITLPQQKLTNGIVLVQVTEGKLTDIQIKGNKYYSDENIRRALPSLTTNIYLNSRWFQPELNRANANQDRQIYPVIGPGLEPGTSELTLKVKDRFPLHGHVEINDVSPPGTPLLRTDFAVQYDNLWQLNHQAGFDYNFSPQEMKNQEYEPDFYNQPLIASYSGYYRIPLGFGGGLRDTYEHQPVDFGYDEITHSFKPLPKTGDPDLIIFASRSVSDTPVRYGPLTVVFTNTDATLDSQSAQENLTYNDDVGTRLTLPLPAFAGVQSSLLLGVDYKYYDAPSFSTNLTYFSLYAQDEYGNPYLVTNATINLPYNSTTKLWYVPLSVGWSAARPDSRGNTSFFINENIFLAALAAARTNFQTETGSTAAGGNYTVFTAGLNRLEKLPGEWSILARASGQWATAPLISNEQMPLGGSGGVRGYQEGEVYGDDGWKAMLDLNAPAIEIGAFPVDEEPGNNVPAMLRTSIFMDYGNTWLIDRLPNLSSSYTQWGTGFGFFVTAGQHFTARLTVAWALHDTLDTQAGNAQAYFSVGYQF